MPTRVRAQSNPPPTHPFRIPRRTPLATSGLARRIVEPKFAVDALEHVLALPAIEALYARVAASPSDPTRFAAESLDVLGVTTSVSTSDLERVPRTGAAIVAANHPFGAIEGLILLATLGRLRSDVKILANRWLARIPALAPAVLPVDVFGGENAVRDNARAFRAAIEHLEAGGMIAVFPAGEVSRWSVRGREVRDAPWSTSLVRMAARTRAPIVPAWFAGRNSALFQILSLVHPRLSTAMLPRELLKKRGSTIELSIGTPIVARELDGLVDDEARSDYVRLRAAALGERERGAAKSAISARRAQPICPPVVASLVESELSALPRDRWLARTNEFEVWLARATSIPNALREIGRQREIAFRAVGEGTGRAFDLDRFDDTYLHVVLWDTRARRIAGAYRMGATDEILARDGVAGLYTSTLFDWDASALRELGTALELGRSFVAAEYQRSYAPLLALWRGIGAFVARNPRYARLFGPVSISSAYTPLTRQLIAQHLASAHAAPAAFAHVEAKNPLVTRKVDGIDGARLRRALGGEVDVEALVRDIEGETKGLPILLREYLKLGGRVIAQNVDADFNDALDALVVVDLRATESRRLERYLGTEGAAHFQAVHATTRANERTLRATG